MLHYLSKFNVTSLRTLHEVSSVLKHVHFSVLIVLSITLDESRRLTRQQIILNHIPQNIYISINKFLSTDITFLTGNFLEICWNSQPFHLRDFWFSVRVITNAAGRKIYWDILGGEWYSWFHLPYVNLRQISKWIFRLFVSSFLKFFCLDL